MFQFKQQGGSVVSLKTNRGSSEDAGVITTLKISVEDVRADAVAYALGADNVDSLVDSLFRDDEDQNARFPELGHLKSNLMMDNAHTLRIDDLPEVKLSRLYDVRIQPRCKELCNVSFVVTVHDAPDGYIDAVAHLLKAPAAITLVQDASAKPSKDPRQTSMGLPPGEGDDE